MLHCANGDQEEVQQTIGEGKGKDEDNCPQENVTEEGGETSEDGKASQGDGEEETCA